MSKYNSFICFDIQLIDHEMTFVIMTELEKAHPMTPDNTAHLISQARRLINLHLMAEMEKAGIHGFVPSHGDIITTLLKNETMTMRELASAIQRDPSTVTTLVKKLERLGYISLDENPQDTRSRLVSLTLEGRALKDEFAPISQGLAQRMWRGIDREEREQFRETLFKIIQNFKNPQKETNDE